MIAESPIFQSHAAQADCFRAASKRARRPIFMNDKKRIEFLAGLVKNCPTASFHFNGDHDMTFPDGNAMPVGFTIRVEGVCDPVRVTDSTFRKCVDSLRREMGDSGEIF